mmetsp:Transcript_39201/g.110816  ORF Transcript_39201/g.110816 Transcript_39201/m.110816 type:complete len:239 (-) Transcript_39201:18-734(-)
MCTSFLGIASCRRGPGSDPSVMVDFPPGGAWRNVVGRSVRTLPQFWFAPCAKRFAETDPPATATPAGSNARLSDEFPPGGACRPVVERSVITLPQFWLLPCAKLFADVLAGAGPAGSKARLMLEFPPGGAWRPVVERSERMLPQFWLWPCAKVFADARRGTDPCGSKPRLMVDAPPGGAWRPVDGRSVMTLPQFWLLPCAKVFEDIPERPPAASPKPIDDMPPGACRAIGPACGPKFP